MKKLLALLLALCTCVAVLSSCASCADEDENEKVEVPTAESRPSGNASHLYGKDAIDPALIDQIKEGYSYDKITEIFGGVKGKMTNSMYWGLYRYILNDGRLLYINYDQCAFATSIYIEGENKEITYPFVQPQKDVSFDNLDAMKQHLISTYAGKETKIAMPALVSSEYKFGKALDTKAFFSYSFAPAAYGWEDKEFYDGLFTVEVYKIDILYEDMVDYYDKEDRNELIECREGVTFVKNWGRFLFDNNGRVITVDIPLDLREEKTHLRDENSPPAITTLEELEKYLVIEYLDLPGAEE